VSFPDVPALFDSSTEPGSAQSAIHRISTQISCEIRLVPVVESKQNEH
jgi:hypothetical protein